RAAMGAPDRARTGEPGAVSCTEDGRTGRADRGRTMNWLMMLIIVVFGIAAVLTLVRVIGGPSILDRAVASDVLLTEVMCVIGAEMAINGHTRSIPVLLIIAAVGAFGSIAVARYVARRDNTTS